MAIISKITSITVIPRRLELDACVACWAYDGLTDAGCGPLAWITAPNEYGADDIAKVIERRPWPSYEEWGLIT
jgi:hypothetical protein